MPAPTRSLPAIVLGLVATLPFGGCVDSSPVSLANLVSVSLTYPFPMDAMNPTTNVTVDAAGDATCSRTDSSGTQWQGVLPASDSTIPKLLSRPGVLHDLTTLCDPHVSDAGPYLRTRLANDETEHVRVVDGDCANDGLDQLVQAMEKIGDACIAVATARSALPDGGPVDAPPDGAHDLAPVDSGGEAGPDLAADADCVVPLTQLKVYCPENYDDVLASRVAYNGGADDVFGAS